MSPRRKESPHKQDDKVVVSLEHGDELVQEHAQGVDQSIIEVNCLCISVLHFLEKIENRNGRRRN